MTPNPSVMRSARKLSRWNSSLVRMLASLPESPRTSVKPLRTREVLQRLAEHPHGLPFPAAHRKPIAHEKPRFCHLGLLAQDSVTRPILIRSPGVRCPDQRDDSSHHLEAGAWGVGMNPSQLC